jgi:helix-turn-helix protein
MMPARHNPPDRRGRQHSLYGDQHGNWVLLESAPGLIPPPALEACTCGGYPPPPSFRVLRRFGSPRDLVTIMCDHMPDVIHGDGRGAPIQRTMATRLGVTQQSISRYLNGYIEPDLPDLGWQQLARLAAAWTEWPGHEANPALVRAILTGEHL